MVALATALQHVIRDQDLTNTPDSEKKGIAFAFAGLPSIVDDLTGNDVLTFLRRSQRRILKEIPLLEVRDAYASVVSKSGKEIPEEIALDAARKAGGHPYMIQLVGYYMWRAAERRGSRIIESCDVSTGESDALLAFYEAICAPLSALEEPQAGRQNIGPASFASTSSSRQVMGSCASPHRIWGTTYAAKSSGQKSSRKDIGEPPITYYQEEHQRKRKLFRLSQKHRKFKGSVMVIPSSISRDGRRPASEKRESVQNQGEREAPG